MAEPWGNVQVTLDGGSPVAPAIMLYREGMHGRWGLLCEVPDSNQKEGVKGWGSAGSKL